MFKDNTTEHLTVDGCKEVLQEWLGKRKFKAMSRMMWLRPLQLTCVATFVSVYSLSISNIGRNWIEMVHNQEQTNIWMKVGGYHDYICIRGKKNLSLKRLHIPPSPWLWNDTASFLLRLHPTVTAFVLWPDANEAGLSGRDCEAAPSHVSLWPQDVDVYCRPGPYCIPSAT